MGSELRIGKSKIIYNLDPNWKINQMDSTEGIKFCIFKRKPITDSNNIDVIPNILIKVFRIHPKEIFIDNPDSNMVELDLMTRVLLLNNAPLEVMEEYDESKNKEKKYDIPYRPSYIFVSNYKDNFNEPHDCFYITLMKPNTTGAFIIIDSTQETFIKIENEIQEFINSISLE